MNCDDISRPRVVDTIACVGRRDKIIQIEEVRNSDCRSANMKELLLLLRDEMMYAIFIL